MSAPERIWAIPVGGPEDMNFSNAWIVMGHEEGATEYVRADLLTAARAEIARLTAERDAAMAGRVDPLTVDEIAGIIERTEVADMTAAGDRRWTQRMAEALAEKQFAAIQPDAERAEPVAWMRKWFADGNEGTRGKRPNGWQFREVTTTRIVPDDIPLYTAPQPAPAPQAREITVQEAAEVPEVKALIRAAREMQNDMIRRARMRGPDAPVAAGHTAWHDFCAALRALADMQKGG